jgi:hypothetical protein
VVTAARLVGQAAQRGLKCCAADRCTASLSQFGSVFTPRSRCASGAPGSSGGMPERGSMSRTPPWQFGLAVWCRARGRRSSPEVGISVEPSARCCGGWTTI